MKTINAVRDTNGVDGAFGKWTNPDTGSVWQSEELEVQNNEPDISSIPPVITDTSPVSYQVELRPHPKEGVLGNLIGQPGMCYEILNVPGRTAVLIHIANYAGQVSAGERTDLLGCVALGTDRGKMLPPGYNQPQEAVEHSTAAIQAFYKEMGGEPFTLNISNQF